jgi:glutathione peroxidase
MPIFIEASRPGACKRGPIYQDRRLSAMTRVVRRGSMLPRPETPMAKTIHDFSAKTIDGQQRSLAEYEGKVALVVNVASECGLTPQYTGLEQLHETYGPRGLAVLGFPANEFGAQEPGSEVQIKEFCTTAYGVKFDMFAKVKVKGAGIDPLFQFLTSPETNPGFSGDIKWNFNKFLIGKNGEVLARFEPSVEPGSPEVKAAIEKALAT